MPEKLDRQNCISLLNALGDKSDAKVLRSARTLHSQLTESGITWDDILIPDASVAREGTKVHLDDETNVNFEDDMPEVLEDDMPEVLEDEMQVLSIGTEETDEALRLINQISALDISDQTREELEDHKKDIEGNVFDESDLIYLRAFHKRLTKHA